MYTLKNVSVICFIKRKLMRGMWLLLNNTQSLIEENKEVKLAQNNINTQSKEKL